MSKNEKQSYLAAIVKRYRASKKGAKKLILDEFCAVCQYNRKYAIRVLNGYHSRNKRKQSPGPKPIYRSEEILKALKKIWFTADQPCSKRMVAMLPHWLPFYEQRFGHLSEKNNSLILKISASTIDRLLAPVRIKQNQKGLCGTKPGTLLRNKIPIRTDFWDITEPGFMEADTVAHCGNSLAGDFVWSLTLTDYRSEWTECRATWGKGSEGVKAQIIAIEKTLPFELKGFDCDNGSEFLNHHLLRYFQERIKPVQFTRSRPYKKNDNAHVEQKNWTHVRQLFGYDRFDNIELVTMMNDLYENEWSQMQNYFRSTMKLKEKTRINSKYKRTYFTPETPYNRLLKSNSISDSQKQKLKYQYEKLDPFKLKATIERKLKAIFKLVSVTPNVRLRL